VIPVIPTDEFSARLRERAVRLDSGELLVSTFTGSDQEGDLTAPPNCSGVGRIRHFHRSTSPGWPENSLPIDPARSFLGLEPADTIEAQVFQNAVCNWRCWYCYVPFNMLSGNEKRSAWVTPRRLVDEYLAFPDRPPMIDLTGGQPDLVPEWIPWTISALRDAEVSDSVYLWSDDNLSNDYFFRYLSDETRAMIAEYPGYGRVCCFKGFDEQSFAFNTQASPDLFDRQFALFTNLLAAGLDLYAYATFTTPSADDVPRLMTAFVDRLQRIAETLPLRLIPLEIDEYGPVTPRLKDVHRASMENQQQAIQAWVTELERRFTGADLALSITDVPLGRSR
jgi:uncharacterized Fe-S cluster-containing radical SAM superfamily protein